MIHQIDNGAVFKTPVDYTTQYIGDYESNGGIPINQQDPTSIMGILMDFPLFAVYFLETNNSIFWSFGQRQQPFVAGWCWLWQWALTWTADIPQTYCIPNNFATVWVRLREHLLYFYRTFIQLKKRWLGVGVTTEILGVLKPQTSLQRKRACPGLLEQMTLVSSAKLGHIDILEHWIPEKNIDKFA